MAARGAGAAVTAAGDQVSEAGATGAIHSDNAFRQGLTDAGVTEVAIEDRWADGHYDRLPALAADLLNHRVAVIAAAFLPAALAAKEATRTTPIVFLSGSDPIGARLGSSFNPSAAPQLRDLLAAARALGLQPISLAAANEHESDNSFAMLAQRDIGALIVTADGFVIGRQDRIVALAARYRKPTMYLLSQYVSAGGLISYGANLPDAYRQTGIYVGRFLKAVKPGDLPVLQPTKVELVINLKTAKALGLTVPPTLLAIADDAIE